MKIRKLWSMVALILVAIMVAGCGQMVVLVPVTTDQPEAGPAEVVESFYTWYLDLFNSNEEGVRVNPLVEGTYRDAPQLSPEFVAEVDAIIAGFEHGGYDPLLLAQDVPTQIRVAEAEVKGDQARVKVYTTFFAHVLDVSLEDGEGGWLITGVASASEPPTGERPEEMVEWFYTNYLNYPGNPLVSRAFLSRATMTDDFVEKVSEILSSFERGGYDPILLAQDVPESVAVGTAEIEGDRASVRVTTSFEGHVLLVRLQQEAGVWKIADIEPAK
jgi:hypothetical protein